jgi:hypothetical protein
MLLRKLIAFAVTSGLAKKAWDHYRKEQPAIPVDITEVIARPVATADPLERQRARSRRGAGGRPAPPRGPKLVTVALQRGFKLMRCSRRPC